MQAKCFGFVLDIIDIGAASTRPGSAKLVTIDEEANILLPVIRSIRREYPVFFC